MLAMGKKHLGMAVRETPAKLAIPPANIIAVDEGPINFLGRYSRERSR